MAALTVQTISSTGLEQAYTAAGALGDTFDNTGKTFMAVKNASGASIDVTIASSKNCNQGFDHDPVIAVANGAEAWIGPFPRNRFSDTVSATYSDETSVTVAAFKLP